MMEDETASKDEFFGNIAIIRPGTHVTFHAPGLTKDEVESRIHVTNIAKNTIICKTRSTNPQYYGLSPHFSKVYPGETEEMSVFLKMENPNPEADRFQIVILEVKDESVDPYNLTNDEWAGRGKLHYQRMVHKLDCKVEIEASRNSNMNKSTESTESSTASGSGEPGSSEASKQNLSEGSQQSKEASHDSKQSEKTQSSDGSKSISTKEPGQSSVKPPLASTKQSEQLSSMTPMTTGSTKHTTGTTKPLEQTSGRATSTGAKLSGQSRGASVYQPQLEQESSIGKSTDAPGGEHVGALATISPATKLTFDILGSVGDEAKARINITNTTAHAIVCKTRSTNPNYYGLHPHYVKILPGRIDHTDVFLSLDNPAPESDKFQIIILELQDNSFDPYDLTSEDWAGRGKHHVQRETHKLTCEVVNTLTSSYHTSTKSASGGDDVVDHEEHVGSIAIVKPGKFVTFDLMATTKKEVKTTVEVTNIAAGTIVCKAKSTNPTYYGIQPHYAKIPPGKTDKLSFFLQRANPNPTADKFQILIIELLDSSIDPYKLTKADWIGQGQVHADRMSLKLSCNVIPADGYPALRPPRPSSVEGSLKTLETQHSVDTQAAHEASWPTFGTSSTRPSMDSVKEEFVGSIAVISPGKKITFEVHDQQQTEAKAKVDITNIASNAIACKTRSTNPEHYKIQPHLIKVNPGSTGAMNIILALDNKSADLDKFQILVLEMADPHMNPKTLTVEDWKGQGENQLQLMKHRLACEVVTKTAHRRESTVTANSEHRPPTDKTESQHESASTLPSLDNKVTTSKEEFIGNIAIIRPGNFLNFHDFGQKNQMKDTIFVTNTATNSIVCKARTTSPKYYSIHPSKMKIAAGSLGELEVRLSLNNPQPTKDKFQVLIVELKDNSMEPYELTKNDWAGTGKNQLHFMKHTISCKIKEPDEVGDKLQSKSQRKGQWKSDSRPSVGSIIISAWPSGDKSKHSSVALAADEYVGEIAVIRPLSHLVFDADGSEKEATALVSVTNITSKTVACKARCSNPKYYTIHPSVLSVSPGDTKEMKFVLNLTNKNPFTDKFQIIVIELKDDTFNIKNLTKNDWSGQGPNQSHHMIHRLQCQVVGSLYSTMPESESTMKQSSFESGTKDTKLAVGHRDVPSVQEELPKQNVTNSQVVQDENTKHQVPSGQDENLRQRAAALQSEGYQPRYNMDYVKKLPFDPRYNFVSGSKTDQTASRSPEEMHRAARRSPEHPRPPADDQYTVSELEETLKSRADFLVKEVMSSKTKQQQNRIPSYGSAGKVKKEERKTDSHSSANRFKKESHGSGSTVKKPDHRADSASKASREDSLLLPQRAMYQPSATTLSGRQQAMHGLGPDGSLNPQATKWVSSYLLLDGGKPMTPAGSELEVRNWEADNLMRQPAVHDPMYERKLQQMSSMWRPTADSISFVGSEEEILSSWQPSNTMFPAANKLTLPAAKPKTAAGDAKRGSHKPGYESTDTDSLVTMEQSRMSVKPSMMSIQPRKDFSQQAVIPAHLITSETQFKPSDYSLQAKASELLSLKSTEQFQDTPGKSYHRPSDAPSCNYQQPSQAMYQQARKGQQSVPHKKMPHSPSYKGMQQQPAQGMISADRYTFQGSSQQVPGSYYAVMNIPDFYFQRGVFRGSLATISPAETLMFDETTEGETLDHIVVKNTYRSALGVKVKATSAQYYQISPKVLKLFPGETKTLTIYLQPGHPDPPRDRFLIMVVELENKNMDPCQLTSDTWQGLSGKERTMFHKLRCNLKEPLPVPDLPWDSDKPHTPLLTIEKPSDAKHEDSRSQYYMEGVKAQRTQSMTNVENFKKPAKFTFKNTDGVPDIALEKADPMPSGYDITDYYAEGMKMEPCDNCPKLSEYYQPHSTKMVYHQAEEGQGNPLTAKRSKSFNDLQKPGGSKRNVRGGDRVHKLYRFRTPDRGATPSPSAHYAGGPHGEHGAEPHSGHAGGHYSEHARAHYGTSSKTTKTGAQPPPHHQPPHIADGGAGHSETGWEHLDKQLQRLHNELLVQDNMLRKVHGETDITQDQLTETIAALVAELQVLMAKKEILESELKQSHGGAIADTNWQEKITAEVKDVVRNINNKENEISNLKSRYEQILRMFQEKEHHVQVQRDQVLKTIEALEHKRTLLLDNYSMKASQVKNAKEQLNHQSEELKEAEKKLHTMNQKMYRDTLSDPSSVALSMPATEVNPTSVNRAKSRMSRLLGSQKNVERRVMGMFGVQLCTALVLVILGVVFIFILSNSLTPNVTLDFEKQPVYPPMS